MALIRDAPLKHRKSNAYVKEEELDELISSSSEEEDSVFEVEAILDWRKKGSTKVYHIKWKGYASEDNTWEEESNILILDEFWAARKEAIEEKKRIAAATSNRTTNNSFELIPGSVSDKKKKKTIPIEVERQRDMEHLNNIGKHAKHVTTLPSQIHERPSLANMKMDVNPANDALMNLFTSDEEPKPVKVVVKRRISTDSESNGSIIAFSSPPKTQKPSKAPIKKAKISLELPVMQTTQSYLAEREKRKKEAAVLESERKNTAIISKKPAVHETIVAQGEVVFKPLVNILKNDKNHRESILFLEEDLLKVCPVRQPTGLVAQKELGVEDTDYVKATQFSSPEYIKYKKSIDPNESAFDSFTLYRKNLKEREAKQAERRESTADVTLTQLPYVKARPEKAVDLTQTVMSQRTFDDQVQFNLNSPSAVSKRDSEMIRSPKGDYQTPSAAIERLLQLSNSISKPLDTTKSIPMTHQSDRMSISTRPLFEVEEPIIYQTPTTASPIEQPVSGIQPKKISNQSPRSLQSNDSEYLSDISTPLIPASTPALKKRKAIRYELESTLPASTLMLNSWTGLLKSIDTMKRVSPTKILYYVTWKDGVKTIHESRILHERAGAMLVAYFESLIE